MERTPQLGKTVKTPADQEDPYGRIYPFQGKAKRDVILMNERLRPDAGHVRCCACHRLLLCAEPDAIAAAIRIKCPRCKALNTLRPDRAPTIERPARQTDRRDECPTRSLSKLYPWVGGKRNLAKRICAIIDADQHTTYAEPFVGMGGIFLRRTSRPRAEFINDRSRDVHTLFRVLQEHYVAFLDLLRFQITTQANFIRLLEVDPDTLTDMQRAARFLYLQKISYGGKVSGQTFGLSRERAGRFNLTTLEPDLEALHSRLAGVCVTCMDYAEFIARIDSPSTLFYLDPPYWGCEGYYGKTLFSRERFVEMADLLAGLKGRFILSLNDVPEVREIFGRFTIEEVTTTYTIAGKGAQPERRELLIRG